MAIDGKLITLQLQCLCAVGYATLPDRLSTTCAFEAEVVD
jgi:hypothetical protein